MGSVQFDRASLFQLCNADMKPLSASQQSQLAEFAVSSVCLKQHCDLLL